MKIVLTGAAGAVGKELVRQRPDIVPIKVRPGEMIDLSNLLSAVDEDAVLIHAGALVHSNCLPDLIRANVELPAAILEMFKTHREELPNVRVILTSSMSFLAGGERIKSVADMSPYAYSKYLMESLTYRYDFALPVRFSTLFYRDPQRDGLSKIIHEAKHKGVISISECSRDFIPLDRACKVLLELCDKPSCFSSNPINIATGQTTNLSDVAKHLNAKYGTGVIYNKDTGLRVCDNFGKVSKYGLTPFKTDLYQEIEEYYANA